MSAVSESKVIRATQRSLIVPVLPVRGKIEPALDLLISDFARDNSPIEPAVRNALYSAYAPRMQRLLMRLWYRNLSGFGCDIEDLQQEMFLIFDTLLLRWSGAGSLSAYLHGAMPWRLYDAARRLAPRDRPIDERVSASPEQSFSQTDAGMVVLLEELSNRLTPFDRALLLAHIRDGQSLAQFASERGMSQRTVRRAWLRLRQHLARELGV